MLPTEPALHIAVLTCMDSRIDLFDALGLTLGEAHLVRNAGGIASDDAIRSLLLSQWLLGTRSIMVIHHTRCGLETFEESDAATRRSPTNSRASRHFRLGAYSDVEEDVREQRCARCAKVPSSATPRFSGFVYDVDDGALREIPVAYSNFLKP